MYIRVPLNSHLEKVCIHVRKRKLIKTAFTPGARENGCSAELLVVYNNGHTIRVYLFKVEECVLGYVLHTFQNAEMW